MLDNVYANIEPNLYSRLVNLVMSDECLSNHNEIIKFIKSKFVKTSSSFGKNYWIMRGWDIETAKIKEKQRREKYKKNNTPSPFSKKFWEERLNPITKTQYTSEEAEFKRNSLRPIRPEYWIIKGYNKEQAIKLAQESKHKNNINGANSNKNKTILHHRVKSKRCKEYWIYRGYNETEALIKVKETQATFSLEKCVKKYGEYDGTEIWKKRQVKWQNTLSAKPIEEIERINRSKIAFGYSISQAEQKLYNIVLSEYPAATSQKTLKYKNKSFIYDICVDNKIIEYNGTYWHADPRFHNKTDILRKNIIAEEIWKKDEIKRKAAIENGYEILIIWEHDFKNNEEREIKKCLAFLKR